MKWRELAPEPRAPAAGVLTADTSASRSLAAGAVATGAFAFGAVAARAIAAALLFAPTLLLCPALGFAQPPNAQPTNAQSANQGPADALLAQANQFYREGRYAQAARSYQELFKTQPDDPYLHYNLANAYFKEGAAGSLGRAIAEYLRAYRRLPRDPDIRHNLDFAFKRAGESLAPAGMPQELHRMFYFLSDTELLGLQWIGCWLSLLLAAAYLLRLDWRTRLRPWIAGAAVFWAFFGCWWGVRFAGAAANPGVILDSNAEVRSGPGLNFPVTFNAPEGRRVSILSQDGDWLEIGVLKEGLRGWVAAKTVEKI